MKLQSLVTSSPSLSQEIILSIYEKIMNKFVDPI